MKTEDLLAELTPDTASADALVAAARTHARRRRHLREAAAAAVVLATGAGAIAFLSPGPAGVRPMAAAAPAAAAHLTADELLDSFGDQPVALVTYPDGSQRLLAVVRPAIPLRP